MRREFPFPAFPDGWFVVAWSDELEAGGVLPLRYFGQDLVLFRGEDGVPRALDAHCRHLGAHLGHGGKVEGGAIRCPFHAWRWTGDGRCDDIPYAKRIPKGAQIRAWPVLDRSGLILLWHHAEGEAPSYDVPEIPEVGAADWTPFTKLDWTVKSRMYDMGENAVDHVHFKYLHGASGTPTRERRTDSDGSVRNSSRMQMRRPGDRSRAGSRAPATDRVSARCGCRAWSRRSS